MPKWVYVVVRHVGGPQQRRQICARIRQKVEEYGLSHVLPLVKYELGANREYYLGIAADAGALVNGREAEDAARMVLVEAGISGAGNRRSSYVLEAEEVRDLLRGSLECESFTIPITHEVTGVSRAPASDDLLADISLSDMPAAEPSAVESEKYRRLLYWCSAIGSGELERIKYACKELGIDDEWGGAWSVLRRLVLLGHLEFDGGRALRWAVIPPTLATTADGDRSFLVGQRVPGLVESLGEKVEERLQAGGPPRILIAPGGHEHHRDTGQQLRTVGCISLRMSKLLPDLSGWMRQLPEWSERDFGRFDAERYDPHADVFRAISTICGQPPSGLYRFTTSHGPQRIVRVAFADDARGQWVCGDFYGLRYLARAQCGLCQTVYHSSSQQLVIPISDRWPMPYERVLVLARGALPSRLSTELGVPVLVYEGITPDLASRMYGLMGIEKEGVSDE